MDIYPEQWDWPGDPISDLAPVEVYGRAFSDRDADFNTNPIKTNT